MHALTLLALFGSVTKAEMVIKIDDQAIAKEMDYWDQWLNQEDTKYQLKNAVGKTFEDAFNRAKLRIDIESAKIYRPWAEDMNILSKYLSFSENCNTNSFHECLIDSGEYK